MKNKTFYILLGLPYSGKTTLRNELVKRFGFSYVSADNVMEEMGMWDSSYGPLTQEDWDKAYTKVYERLKEYLKDGKSVVLDMGHLKRSERDTARNIAKSLDIPFKLIYVNTPSEEVFRRRKENEATKLRGHLDDESFQKALDMFEEPTLDENPILYNQEIDLDTWIKENVA